MSMTMADCMAVHDDGILVLSLKCIDGHESPYIKFIMRRITTFL